MHIGSMLIPARVGTIDYLPTIAAPLPRAQVIAMLKRTEGATITQIGEAKGWQQHTVCGTFAGAFKKKLGLHLVSEKVEGGNRVYGIT